MAHLGWSPIARRMLKCKRKSSPQVDEGEDGARAAIIEEAVVALVFSSGKQRHFYEGSSRVDYDLLKTIQVLVQGYEVASAPLWQWELSILEGFRLFRQLKMGRGGVVKADQINHTVTYSTAAESSELLISE
jgi:hypothetical protein